MKRVFFSLIIGLCFFVSCSKIPSTSIGEELPTKALSKAIKSDTTFADFYDEVRGLYDGLSKVDQAKHVDITYRELFKYTKYLQDTTRWNPKYKEWEKEWNGKYLKTLKKADSVIVYWKKYKEDHSLNNYVNIELAKVWNEYYEYIGGIKNVNFGFLITPLQGKIDQLRFTYRFVPKISDTQEKDAFDYTSLLNTHSCILTTPVSAPSIKYWEAQYEDERRMQGMNKESVLRDYNLYIEVMEIRKDGENLSMESLGIPETVELYLRCESESFAYLCKDDVAKELVDSTYKSLYEYQGEKKREICKKKNESCYKFLFEQEYGTGSDDE